MQSIPEQQPGEGSTNASPVTFMRLEVVRKLLSWRMIRAALDGEQAIKELGTLVLPYPQEPRDERDKYAHARYRAYLKRAVWYNVSSRTLEGMTGYVFAKEPTVTLPDTMQGMEANIDGSGVSLQQQCKTALRTILGFGRAGLLVDYPTANDEAPTSRQQLLDGSVTATISLYQPEQIVNWRVSYVGAKHVLNMLVLQECYYEASDEDEFQMIELIQYRVLSLQEDGTVLGRVFQLSGSDKRDYVENHDLQYQPKDNTGKALTEIPFAFIGATDNDANVDNAPMQDLVDLNYAHFRNSADYEESCFMTGQPTPWISGLTKQWVDEILKGEVQLGSRAILPLPVGGQAGLLQAQANSMPFEAMNAKEKQMVALGAKLVELQKTAKTATEAGLDQASEVSILTSATMNVFLAYQQALKYACLFTGADDASIVFELSEPLTHDTITPQQAQAVMALWQGQLVTYTEARLALKKAGLAFEDDDEAREEIAAELPPQPPAGAGAPAGGGAGGDNDIA